MSSSVLIATLLGCIFLAVFFFPLALYHATLFWPPKFLLKNQLIALWGLFVCDFLLFSLAAFKIPSVSPTFSILIRIHLGVTLFGFILFETLCGSLISISLFFPGMVHFQLLFYYICFLPFSFSLYLVLLGPQNIGLLDVPHKSLSCLHLKLSFLFVALFEFHRPVFDFSDPFLCFIKSVVEPL